jgi:uncharacterized alpha-E superfamily protein
MARYMQRAENLARLIDVNETFARNADGENEWLPVLKLHRDEERFAKRYRLVDAARVVQFYIIDDSNPNSIRQCAHWARENARSIRHLISLETWVQLNVFHNWMRKLTSRSLRFAELSRLCGRIKDNCTLHLGVAQSTLYRDQVYLFYELGRLLELCDQTTRLVDIKYHSLLPAVDDVGTPLDVAQWNALLRSASAYHGYRRVYPHEMTPTTVAGFILLDPDFPRSITHCVARIEVTLQALLARDELAETRFAPEAIGELKGLTNRTPDEIIGLGLNAYLDRVQIALNALGDQIAQQFFLAQYAEA